jgi:hypothetical protein
MTMPEPTKEQLSDMDDWAGALVDRLDQYDRKLDQIRLALAKMIVGMSGMPIKIDIEKDLGVTIPRDSQLVVPASVVPGPRSTQ